METILTKGHVPLPIKDEIHACLRKGRGDTFLLIVPTAQARLQRRRECLEYAPNQAVAGLHIHTLEDFVQRLYRHIGRRKQISVGLQTVWLREIVDQGQFTSLKPHEEIPIPQGTVTRLVNAINQLKTSGVYPSHLQADVDESERAAELATIYAIYEQKLADRWIDRGGVHHAVATSLQTEALMGEVFPNVELIVVEGFDVFSPPDSEILTSIARAPKVGMAIVLDFNEQNDSLFGHVKESYDRFLNLGFQTINASMHRRIGDSQPRKPSKLKETQANHPPISQSPNFPSLTRNQHFAQNLFRKAKSSVEILDLTKQITLLQAPERTDEVEMIARLIKQLVLNAPSLALNQICVTFYNLDIYVPLIREIFPLYGISHSLDVGGSLANSPLITSILSLLDAIESEADLRNQCKAQQSPYFVIDDWHLSIDKSQVTKKMPPDAFRKSFDRLMETLQVRQQILKARQTPPLILGEIGAYRYFKSLIDELVEFLISEYGGVQQHSLRAYINWLRLMAMQTTYHVPSPNQGGVCILPLIETKNLDFDVVILGGLVDGEFPATFLPDAFLPATRSLNESDRLRENRFLFYQVFKRFRNHLYLTAPQRDGRTELVQSPFIDELQRIAEIEELDADGPVIFSEEGFLKHYGKFVWDEQAGQFLNSAVAHLPNPTALQLVEHNVRVEKSRVVTHDLLEYEGLLTSDLLSPSGRRTLENLSKHTYSVSRLECYGRCPFQYFSKHILLDGVEEEQEGEEEGLTSLEKGRLLHDILFQFYDSRRDKPPIPDVTDAEFDEAVEELKRIAHRHLDTFKEAGLFWEVDMERITGGSGRRGILPTFLAAERKRNFEVQPRYFEVGFGLRTSEKIDPELSIADAITVGDVAISGKVDRIELGDGIFTIGDYKTGSYLPKILDILEGRSLQLPLYLVVVEQLLKRTNPLGMKGAGGLYYTLREDCKVELGIGDREYNGKAFKASSRNGQLLPNYDYGIDSFQSLIDQVIGYVNQYVSSISRGEFPLTPHDHKLVCRFCSFKKICRVGAIAEDDGEV